MQINIRDDDDGVDDSRQRNTRTLPTLVALGGTALVIVVPFPS